MTINVLVAKMDGVPDRDKTAFAPGSIRPIQRLPVTLDFDIRTPPIGQASLYVDGTDVYALIYLHDSRPISGKYPALGFRGRQMVKNGDVVSFENCEVLTLGICSSQNTDARIPPIP